MRRFLFAIILFATAGFRACLADDTVVQEFSGSGPVKTAVFKVPDRWEVRWNSLRVVSVAVMKADGTIIAGGAGVLRGSIFMPTGGDYCLVVSDDTTPPPPPVPEPAPAPAQLTPGGSTSAPPAAPSPPATTPIAPVTATNAPPAVNSPPVPAPTPAAVTNIPPVVPSSAPATNPPAADAPANDTAAEPAPVSWHLQVVELGAAVASDRKLTVFEPFFVPPDSAIYPVPAPPPPPPPPVLDPEQIKAEVIVKGDRAQGFGFLLQTAEGKFVATSLHLLAANPNLQVLTTTGTVIITQTLKGSATRDLALFAVQDAGYSYLSAPADDAAAGQEGDAVLVPVPNKTTGSTASVAGKIVSTAEDQVQFDNALTPGQTGAPLILVTSEKVIAMVTASPRADVTDNLAKAWAAGVPLGTSNIMPYTGWRLAGVKDWETYDQVRFQQETAFLRQFQDVTRALDSFLHGRHHRRFDPDDGPPDNRYFLNNAVLHKAQDNYRQLAIDTDRSQRLEVTRELSDTLISLADSGIYTMDAKSTFYLVNQTKADEELAYRKALKKELAELQNNLGALDRIAQGH